MAKINRAKQLAANIKPVILGEVDKRLAAKLDERKGIQFWNPKVAGDTIAGKVVDRKDGIKSKFKNHDPISVVTVNTGAGGVFRVDCGAAVLARFIEENKIRKGSVIAIRFTGFYESKAGRRVKGFSTASI